MKPKFVEPLSNFALKFNLRRYTEGCIHITTDFAENITINPNRGAQSFHWSPEEITLCNATLLRLAQLGIDDELIAQYPAGTRIVI